MITIGLEVLAQSPRLIQKGARLGLLTNQASVNRDLVHNRLVLKKIFGGSLTALFSPQHGFYSEKQDNMIESGDEVDLVTGLPVYSLYGDLRKPSRKMLENVDILVIDLMDVGTRVYTFLYTMANCLVAASEFGKKVVEEIINKVDGADLDRVHFSKFGDSSLDFEVVYYVGTGDYNKYMDIQEEINLQIKEKVEKVGVGFAFPSRTIYMAK